MKHIKGVFICLVAVLFAYGCDEGIDSLTQIDPGADESAPQVSINAPTEGNIIQVPSETTSITVDFQVTDDIEVGSIVVML
ncbi:MAG TPA: LamG domain-containing protein, partial [Pricia sp.]|nr:LamG domain-containing protein [Pricia sp.]